jgi:hypothetical protein
VVVGCLQPNGLLRVKWTRLSVGREQTVMQGSRPSQGEPRWATREEEMEGEVDQERRIGPGESLSFENAFLFSDLIL